MADESSETGTATRRDEEDAAGHEHLVRGPKQGLGSPGLVEGPVGTATPERLEDGGPAHPGRLSARAWWETLKRSFVAFQRNNGTDWAAALTYYSVLSMFPAIIVLFSLLGVLGNGAATTDALLDIVRQLGPESAVETLTGPIEDITGNSGAAGALLGVGTAAAIFTASGYLGAFARASNAIYEVEEGRPFWKMRPQQVAMTVVMISILALLAIGLVVTGPVTEAVGDVIGLGSTAVDVWDIAKWPVMVLLVAVMFALLFNWAPNVSAHRFRWISPGSTFAVLAWILASGLFALYVANFSSYSATYGSLGGIIVFLLWLWITNNALLLGQHLNAELERQREIEAGIPGAEDRIQRPLRDDPDD